MDGLRRRACSKRQHTPEPSGPRRAALRRAQGPTLYALANSASDTERGAPPSRLGWAGYFLARRLGSATVSRTVTSADDGALPSSAVPWLRVKTRFDFLDDRAEDAVDLEVFGRVNRRDACGLQSRYVRGRNDAPDNERHVFEAGRAQKLQHLFRECDVRARQDRQADAMDAGPGRP